MKEYKLFLYPKDYPTNYRKIPSPIFFDLGIRNALQMTYHKTQIIGEPVKIENHKNTPCANYEEKINELTYRERILWSDISDSQFAKDNTKPFWNRTRCRAFTWELRTKRSKIKIKERDWEIIIHIYRPTEKEKLKELRTFLNTKIGTTPCQISIMQLQGDSDLLTETIYYSGNQLPEDAIDGRKILLLKIECIIKKGYTFEWIKWFKEAALIQLYFDIFTRQWFNLTRPTTEIAFEKIKNSLFSFLRFLKNYQEVSVYLFFWSIFQVEWATIKWVWYLNQFQMISKYIWNGFYFIFGLSIILLIFNYGYIWLKEIGRLIIDYPFLLPVLFVFFYSIFFE